MAFSVCTLAFTLNSLASSLNFSLPDEAVLDKSSLTSAKSFDNLSFISLASLFRLSLVTLPFSGANKTPATAPIRTPNTMAHLY